MDNKEKGKDREIVEETWGGKEGGREREREKGKGEWERDRDRKSERRRERERDLR